MARLDAINLSDALKERLLSFASADNFLRDADLMSACEELWTRGPLEGGLAGEIWVEAALPPLTSGKTLGQLQADGCLSPGVVKQLTQTREIFPEDRPLYTHQAEACQAAAVSGPRPAIIVSAGTGAGKTESFLLPILSQLYAEKRKAQTGCRAIILYPMNALVNDQVDRLFDWLQGQTRLSICHFTSETPEDSAAADRLEVPRFPQCRHRTRRQARGLEDHKGEKVRPHERKEPPDILITNYSMLEYMLCRPQDRVFFGPGLRAVVLDEAHLYNGTLAAEMTLLLRRLYDKCGVSTDQVANYATSATIGTGAPEELRDFAATIFSKPAELVRVIKGQKAGSALADARTPRRVASPEDVVSVEFETATIVMSPAGEEELLISSTACDALVPLLETLLDAETVQDYRTSCRDTVAGLLLSLAHSPSLHLIDQKLRGLNPPQIALAELSACVWAGRDDQMAQKATARVLSLAASARAKLSDTPLLPHRLHMMLKPPQGISVCCNPRCDGPEALKPDGLGCLAEGRQELCPHCSQRSLSLYRCRTCGQAALAAGRSDSPVLRPPFPFEKEVRIFNFQGGGGRRLHLDPEHGMFSSRGLELWELEVCPNCQEAASDYAPMASADALTLSILAETLFAELPPLACTNKDDNRHLPARGRRLLAFSDSRSEASRLGPRLSRQHDRQILRAAIVKMFAKAPQSADANVAYAKRLIAQKEEELALGLVPEDMRESATQELENWKAKLQGMESGGSMLYWAAELAKDTELMKALLDEESATKHTAAGWISNSCWETNFHENKERAQHFLELEIARLPRRPYVSVETIGCVEVVYSGLEELGPPKDYRRFISMPETWDQLTRIWPDLLSALLDTMRVDQKITLGSYERDVAWSEGDVPMGQWVSASEFRGSQERQRRRRFLKRVLVELGWEGDPQPIDLDRILDAVFEQLLEKAVRVSGFETRATPEPDAFRWLERTEKAHKTRGSEEALRLYLPELALRKPKQLFQCSRTGHVWPRSVLGCAADSGCGPTLEKKTPEELDRSIWVGRSRTEYQNPTPALQIGLWASEHSAQLDPKEGRRLQELFRAGMRNVLSSTTTLELGIDIGGLSGVFLSNVPPGKANYLQRAGRVGRRADGSSVVLTCARTRPYDREVFRRMGDFLSADLRQPVVFLHRDRIVRRHFHAWLMGEFFGQLYEPKVHVGAMNAFGQMGIFCGQKSPDKWRGEGKKKPGWLDPRPCLPEEFAPPVWWPDGCDSLVAPFLAWTFHARANHDAKRLRRLFAGTSLEGTSDWTSLFSAAASRFRDVIDSWLHLHGQLLERWNEAKEAAQANSVRYQIQLMQETTVIGYLSDARFLPRYGFPIGVHKLQVKKPEDKDRARSRPEDEYRLERSSLLALREYVPGSQILVGGKIITSRGLLRHWSGANVDKAFGASGGLQTCENGHQFYWVSVANSQCPYCESSKEGAWESLLFPEHGFTSAMWDPPRRASDTERIGEVDTATVAFTNRANVERKPRVLEDFADVTGLTASYEEEGELLVYNRGDDGLGFIICTACGYSESEKASADKAPPPSFMKHRPLFADKMSKACLQTYGEGAKPLRSKILAAREPTDIVKLDFGDHLRVSGAPVSVTVTSLAVAFQIAGARLLQLDSRELGRIVVPTGEDGSSLGAGIYDTVPGGAGHVAELLESGRAWLEKTRDLLHGTDTHHRLCRNACLDCLMTFDAQMLMVNNDQGLDRRAALAVVERMLQTTGQQRRAGDGTPGKPVPEQGDTGKGLPIYPLQALGEPSPRPSGTFPAEYSPLTYFAAEVTGHGMSRRFTPGDVLLFRRLDHNDPLPDRDALVLVKDASINDVDYGALTFASFRYTRPSGGDDEAPIRVVLRRDSLDRDTYKGSINLDVPVGEWPAWRPLAVFERKLN